MNFGSKFLFFEIFYIFLYIYRSFSESSFYCVYIILDFLNIFWFFHLLSRNLNNLFHLLIQGLRFFQFIWLERTFFRFHIHSIYFFLILSFFLGFLVVKSLSFNFGIVLYIVWPLMSLDFWILEFYSDLDIVCVIAYFSFILNLYCLLILLVYSLT